MNDYLKVLVGLVFTIYCPFVQSQVMILNDPYLELHANAKDPLYTTYAAAMGRSKLYGDKAYKMSYHLDNEPLYYESDKAGRIYNVWMINKVVVDKVGKFYKKPEVYASFPDMVVLNYQPFEGIKVEETFLVHSSSVAVVNMRIQNISQQVMDLSLFPVFETGNDSLKIEGFNSSINAYELSRHESKKRLISNLRKNYPYPTQVRDIFSSNMPVTSYGGYHGEMKDFYNIIKTDYYADNFKNDSLNMSKQGMVDFVALQHKLSLQPGEVTQIRYMRGFQKRDANKAALIQEMDSLKKKSLIPFLKANEELFKNIPRIAFPNRDEKLVYLGALNLARSNMLPPEGKANHNYYVFSRNPMWGWGHGHQVLHESLSMMAYAYLDPQSAEESQRIYIDQQSKDGLIAYRHGPRGAQTYPHKGEPTTSAPFFNWINWEIYEVSKDKTFLLDTYNSGVAYVNWLYRNRDDDKDGTFEWGPYGLIENVRDWYNVVFQVSEERYLDVDKEDISDELECLDLSLMVLKELRSLEKMASVLGKTKEEKTWRKKAEDLINLINERMWDEKSDFYYSVNAKDHSFSFMGRDLRRQEIIGLLPLWAGAAPKDRAEKLVKQLTDPKKFWRKYGIPTLAADDKFYSPYVDYCCKWNGPVWLLWNYMVYEGLKQYGYDNIASQLADKMMLAVTTQLSKNHNFWESYSPDNEVLDSPSNYIWDAIMAKVLIEEYKH